MKPMAEWSPRAQARIAGALYLIVIAGGLFAELGVRGRLVAHGPIAELRRAPGGGERSLESLLLALVGGGRDPARGLDWLG